MEAPAPYTPNGPRNLVVDVAAWLRAQGFTAQEQAVPGAATVAAHWHGPQRERFQLTYDWQGGPVPAATCRLTVHYADAVFPETLFTAQQVRRVADVRRLLCNCVRYANARLVMASIPLIS
ncbi:hypothetical protein Q5H93_14875 [Hymenobacter sp. ASUV-10]|uniref:Uncharacterized protein n=1 Tax=Hymenobacter aranciens TaxID=3063996 RepID=A0ABT9BE23_9BACT|nr:hypothetical protein [Hymenobacter sp. ASUV-10]MDO7876025.1 hypothetical protein [Hymenobacter sp. ASUV-10]